MYTASYIYPVYLFYIQYQADEQLHLSLSLPSKTQSGGFSFQNEYPHYHTKRGHEFPEMKKNSSPPVQFCNRVSRFEEFSHSIPLLHSTCNALEVNLLNTGIYAPIYLNKTPAIIGSQCFGLIHRHFRFKLLDIPLSSFGCNV